MTILLYRSVVKSTPLVARQWVRNHSAAPHAASTTKCHDIDPTKLRISKIGTPSSLEKPENLVFGAKLTDHMVMIEWDKSNGWKAHQIVPYQNLSLDPETCVFYYTLECF
ncbi:hypothetical protein PgNI_05197 [Pyricularia grisea]|uniref:Uncharacterized protein n=1 Tax=Pyricularia grisea TaxID=148305 RepID=A0A6P8B7X0_PYRGI|nr:uncharacterized protein PgNI_12585 [Pyricularia grisea]XP_030983233.1 hypothetical protein PgNI_05197 [Pyricularia grisea]TLD03086.1 hypothetical protein PgNI_12585 [Pyricularia grisea]TLD11343.1 hypothetical protein PgNI_05197 [Pyricularia grisea]